MRQVPTDLMTLVTQEQQLRVIIHAGPHHDDIAAADLVLMPSVTGTNMSGAAPVQLLLGFVPFLLDSCQLLLQLMVLVSILWQPISWCNAWALLHIGPLPLPLGPCRMQSY